MTGASASVSFVSWISSTSGAARSSHHSTFSSRAFSELTFQVAMCIAVGGSEVPAANAGERQVGHGAHGGGDGFLADERNRVDADPLAPQVVPVGLADGAERDLGDLRAAADDDDPFAEDAAERLG